MQKTLPFFRPDIEGLRAIAVLLVIGAHYAVPGLAGGFIGVDIFFVISGYLITGILVREHEATGRIALQSFYANRLRRLLPALALMLSISSVLIAWLLPASTHPAQSQAALAAALWASNLLLAFDQLDYFEAAVSSNAFLHTWSLGVEEQFYLLWPLLLVLVLPWARVKKQRLATFLLCVAFWSLFLCLAWVYTQQPMLAFYMMPARAWQFAAGALAWWGVRQRSVSGRQAVVAGWIGVALIALSLISIGPQTTYPGLWALLPTLGSVALLWAGSGKSQKSPVNTVLCAAPMQGIGRLSYSWYLWHWPMLVIGQHLQALYGYAEHARLALLASLLASLLAAILTHRLIENPIRFGKLAWLRPGVQLFLALGLMALASHQFLRWSIDAQLWLVQHGNSPEVNASADLPLIYQHGCVASFRSDTLNPCTYGSLSAQKTAVLIGDSVGAQWFPAVAKMHDLHEWKIVVLTKSSCPFVDEPVFSSRMGREFTECTTWRNRVVEWLQQNPAQRLFMGSTRYDFSPEQWRQGTQRILERIAPHMQAIYIIEASPSLPFSGPDCLQQQQAERCQAKFNDPRHVPTSTALQQAIQQYPNARWLATGDFVCPKGLCQAQRRIADKEIVIFRDEQHVTASFAATAAAHFLAQMQD